MQYFLELAFRGCLKMMSATKVWHLENALICWQREEGGQAIADIGWGGLANAEITKKNA